MASSIINSDDGVVSGTSGIKTTGGDDGVLVFQSKGTETARIDSSGRVLIGQTSGNYPLEVTGGNGNGIKFTESSNNIQCIMAGFNSTALFGTITNHPMLFWVNNGERARIDSSGNLLVGKTSATANGGDLQISKGITFPATQSAQSNANTLDDYEEGSFTVVLDGTTAVTYNNQPGRYTKIGRIVHVQFLLQTSSQTFASSGATLTLSGLPFAGSFPGYQGGEGAVWFNSITFSNMVSAVVSGTTIQFRQSNSGGASTMLANSAVTGGMIIHGTIVYMV